MNKIELPRKLSNKARIICRPAKHGAKIPKYPYRASCHWIVFEITPINTLPNQCM